MMKKFYNYFYGTKEKNLNPPEVGEFGTPSEDKCEKKRKE